MFLLVGPGLRFLERTYDAVPGNGGYVLRIVDAQGLCATDTFENEFDLVEALKKELWDAVVAHLLGTPYPAQSGAW